LRNPLTFQVESWVGSLLVLAFAVFLVGIFFVALKNFNSEAEILASPSGVNFKKISLEEKKLIDNWLNKTKPDITVNDVGYRYIIKTYPEKPWVSK